MCFWSSKQRWYNKDLYGPRIVDGLEFRLGGMIVVSNAKEKHCNMFLIFWFGCSWSAAIRGEERKEEPPH